MNIKKVIILNLFIIVILLLIAEISSFLTVYKKHENVLKISNIGKSEDEPKNEIAYKLPIIFNYDNYKQHFEKAENKNNKKRPIILFGCSFIEGLDIKTIDPAQTVTQQLSKATKRNVYSRAVGGSGPQFMYYQLNNNDIKQEIPDAEYIIYNYMDYHPFRLYFYTISFCDTDINLRYEYKNGKLNEVKPLFPLLYSSFLVKNIQNKIADHKKEKDKEYKLFKEIMKESYKQAKIKYPDAKFIVLVSSSGTYVYDSKNFKAEIPLTEDCELPADLEKYLMEIGFIVINKEDLCGKKIRSIKYRAIDENHPNGLFWEAIIPPLVKKLNL